jgi:hypothetical protein
MLSVSTSIAERPGRDKRDPEREKPPGGVPGGSGQVRC